MQANPRQLPPLGIIFDSDPSGLEDLLALALLYGMEGRDGVSASVASLTVSSPSLASAAFCEAIVRFYTSLLDRNIPERFRRETQVVIGMASGGQSDAEADALFRVLALEDDTGEALYPTEIRDVVDTADPAALIRNALTGYNDQNTIVIATGPATNLAAVLDLNGAKELIAAKVKYLVISAGSFPSGTADQNLLRDLNAARKVFAEWPTPIYAAGFELGRLAPYPPAALEEDLSWAPHHPVADVYRASAQGYESTSRDLAAALYAVQPEGGYFRPSEPGVVEVFDDGRTKFTPSAGANRYYLAAASKPVDEIVAAYRSYVAGEPKPRELPENVRRRIERERREFEEAEKRAQE